MYVCMCTYKIYQFFSGDDGVKTVSDLCNVQLETRCSVSHIYPKAKCIGSFYLYLIITVHMQHYTYACIHVRMFYTHV